MILFAKFVLRVMGEEEMESCVTNQRFSGLQEGVEGGIGISEFFWESHKTEEDWGSLLIDA